MLKQFGNRAAFTIVELLTVMSVIILLIGLLVPALNQVKRYAMKVEQMNQFHAIAVGLETFSAEWDGYPPSDAASNFCGTMKLCEAMVGLDRGGYEPSSKFDVTDLAMYLGDTDRSDRRSYLKADQANAYSLNDVYGAARVALMFPGVTDPVFVLCDTYRRRITSPTTGRLIGMPVLYYKANTSSTGLNAYNPFDNWPILNEPMQWSGLPHVPGGQAAYAAWLHDAIKDPSSSPPNERPYRSDTFLLQSAGWDGQYGTADDVFNFMKQ